MLLKPWPALCLLALLHTPAWAEVVYTEQTRYYNIYGNTINALRAGLDLGGPGENGKRFAARTDGAISWETQYRSNAQGCRIHAVSVMLNVTTLLPRWADEAAGPAKLRQSWARFMSRLIIHEKGHADIYKLQAEEIDRALPPARTCKVLSDTITATTDRIMHKWTLHDDAYDRDTDHGTKQGATFP